MRDTGGSTPLIALDAVVLDTETTDLDARKARLVQIGCLRLTGGALDAGQTFESLVNPGRPIPKSAVAVHGITESMVAAAPAFAAVAEQLEEFIGDAIVIGHAIGYDLAVLRREYQLAGRSWPNFRTLDVRPLARLSAPSLADHGLDHLCEWLGVQIVGRHSALGDAVATAEVFLRLVPLLRRGNVRTLSEAESAIRALGEREAWDTGAILATPEAVRPRLVRTRLDSFPYRHLVRELMSTPPLFAPPDATLADAVRLMIEKRVSSVFVRTAAGPVGIVTERDVLRAIDASGAASLATRIDALVRVPLQTVAEDAFVYRAIGRMQRLGFRHLGVENGKGEIVGALTNRNLLRYRTSAAIMLGDEIDSAPAPAALAVAWAKLPVVARSLVQEEVDPRTISAVISSEICAMTRRAAQLAEERLNREENRPPPVPYAVLVLGSAGRGESQLAADQDNAIVYAQGKEGGPEDAYFEKLGTYMTDNLDAAGIPYCKGGVMASNRLWRKSVADWHATINDWVRRQQPQDLLNVDIFFDAVPVHGEISLATDIWNHAYERGHAARDFQNMLVELTRSHGSAFTFFGRLRLDGRNRIDLKRAGLMPIFTSARVLSIRHDVRARSTVERLRGAAGKGAAGTPEGLQSVLDAHRVLLGAIIAQQLVDIEAGIPPSTAIDPRVLDPGIRAQLKAALEAVEQVVDLVAEGRV
jgi:CBS domain-containing protein